MTEGVSPAELPVAPATIGDEVRALHLQRDDGDDAPTLGRRARLALDAWLASFRPGRSSRKVLAHGRTDARVPAELVGLQRAMLGLRAFGILVVLTVASAVGTVAAVPLAGGLAALAANVAVQGWSLRRSRLDLIRPLSVLGLIGDSIAAYLLGMAFLDAPATAMFAAYPLLAMEAAVVDGRRGAALSTAASSLAFIAQEQQRAALGYDIVNGFMAVVLGVYTISGVFSATLASLSRRQRGDLTALLEVSSLLARQESPTRIVQALDARLRELVGARIRSVAVRRQDGSYEVLRWRTPETRVITPEAIRRLSAHLGSDVEAEVRAGRALTIRVDANGDEAVIAALGLPDWVRAITLVPILSDGLLSGILPVLWDAPRVPSTAELELLNGFAQQTGLAFEQAALRRARELAATDSLTGLANHRAFRDALSARLAEARRHHRTVSILFCDLDHFKSVNDRHGHAVGDLLLHRVAEAVKAAARAEDVVARYGGDELALLLPETGRFGALDLGRRLREQVKAVENGMGVDLTVGVAVFPEDAEDPESLVARADAAMSAGKRLGGGRVVLASELPAEA